VPRSTEPPDTNAVISRPRAAPDGEGYRRIVYVIDTLTTGGTERHLVRLASGMLRAGGWDVAVYCLSRRGGFLAAMNAAGVEVVGPDEPFQKDPRAIGKSIRQLTRYLRIKAPGIVHCYLPTSGLIGSVAARLASVPLVVTTRRSVHAYSGPSLWRYRATGRLTDRLSDAVIAVCEAARLQALKEGTPAAKLFTVYNALTALPEGMPEAPQLSGNPIIGAVGGMIAYKGHRDLIEAMPAILAKLPKAHLALVGDGPERRNLEALAGALGLNGYISFQGESHSVASLLRQFDVFVMPSLLEGMPNALMEAMGAGIACIGTRVGGIPELIDDGTSGLLVSPRAPHEIAHAVIRLAGDPALRSRLAAQARSSVHNRFGDPDREVADTKAVYRHLIETSGSR
jgi:glycosyltransferase involved in cell wall biosynthesis